MTPLEYDRSFLWHPYASLKDPPPVRLVKSASGVNLTLADGSQLVDGVSSWWCVAHGHNHPAIVEAIRRQSGKLCHVMFGGFTHEPAIELGQRLTALMPPGLNKVFFADSGSISVEVATKMAIQYQQAKGRPSRCKLVALKGGYHGDTACAMALSDPDGMHTLFRGMMPKHFFAEKPAPEFSTAWLVDLERTVSEHEDEIAGMICEPIFQAANAMNFYEAHYLQELRRICDEHDFVLIFDEIAAGFYRTGPLWAHRRANLAPDVMTVGKALTGGHMTLAATIASEKVADVISNGSVSAFMHGPTYMANPLACSAALASLDLFARSDYQAKVTKIESVFKADLAPLASLSNVKGVRVLGAAGVVEVETLPARADIERVITEHGVWLRPFSNFLYAMPPLVTDESTLHRITAALAALAACPPGPVVSGDFHE